MQYINFASNWFYSYKTMSNKNITQNLRSNPLINIDWATIQKDMKSKLGNDIYESWLRKINFVEEMNNYI